MIDQIIVGWYCRHHEQWNRLKWVSMILDWRSAQTGDLGDGWGNEDEGIRPTLIAWCIHQAVVPDKRSRPPF